MIRRVLALPFHNQITNDNVMKIKFVLIYLALLTSGALLGKIFGEMGDRHTLIDGKYYVAKHVYLPGFEARFPELMETDEEHFYLDVPYRVMPWHPATDMK